MAQPDNKQSNPGPVGPRTLDLRNAQPLGQASAKPAVRPADRPVPAQRPASPQPAVKAEAAPAPIAKAPKKSRQIWRRVGLVVAWLVLIVVVAVAVLALYSHYYQ